VQDYEDLEEGGGIGAVEGAPGIENGREDAGDEEEELHEFVEDVADFGVEGGLLADFLFDLF
jgi:hypothetical protein